MKRMCELFLAFTLVFLLCQESKGQDEEILKGKIFLAPDFGLMAGTTTRIEFSPALGYYLTDRLCLAGGFIYQYYKQSGKYLYNYETNIYGPKAYARYTLIKNLGNLFPIQSNIEIMAHIEFESISLAEKYFGLNPSNTNNRFWYTTALIGGGISQTASERIKINALILWDVDTSSRSPHSNPTLRLGIQFMFKNKTGILP
jgi:hypothetical protein